jgi:hypothetical protein
MGTDLPKRDKSKALIIHHNAYAYLKNNQFVLYQEEETPLIYDFEYHLKEHNETLIKEGLAYIYGSQDIYDHQKHQGVPIEKQ